MEATKVSADGLVQIRLLAEVNRQDKNHINHGLYRILCSEEVLVTAYQNIKSKSGNMTRGCNSRTLDGYSLDEIHKVIRELETEAFRFSPARVQMIPKKNGKLRALGIAPPPEKVVQEAMRMILEVIYEPSFSANSHGFRPGRSCHTALKQVFYHWHSVKWIIEGDISAFFDNIDHHVLIDILRRRIKDERFIKLVWKALRAGRLVVPMNDDGKPRYRGYPCKGTYYQTKVGTPQGSIVSPILANIYLNEFDRKVEEWADEVKALKTVNNITSEYRSFNGQSRNLSRKIDELVDKGQLIRGSQEHKAMIAKVRALKEGQRKTQCKDGEYRAIKYVRYADDWLIGIYGTKEMAKSVKDRAEQYLCDVLKLELSPQKTLITRPSKDKVKFLGAYLKIDPTGHIIKKKSGPAKRPALAISGRGAVRLEAPIDDLMNKLVADGFAYKGSYRPKARRELLYRQEWELVTYYNSVLRGILNFYTFAANRARLGRVVFTLEKSLLLTLASRRKCSGKQVWRKGRGKITAYKPTKDGMTPVHFNGYSNGLTLSANRQAFNTSCKVLNPDELYTKILNMHSRSKLGMHCAICGSNDRVQMHHIKHVRKMGQKVQGFSKVMAQINRKQVPVCHECHGKIHNGQYDSLKLSDLADEALARW